MVKWCVPELACSGSIQSAGGIFKDDLSVVVLVREDASLIMCAPRSSGSAVVTAIASADSSRNETTKELLVRLEIRVSRYPIAFILTTGVDRKACGGKRFRCSVQRSRNRHGLLERECVAYIACGCGLLRFG